MASAAELFERPRADEIYMIAGWRQWADAGSVSSGLPRYLIDTLGARRIGQIKPDGFYLFQTPVSQFLFRPRVKFVEGHREEMTGPSNDVYYWSDGGKGLVIFIGDEPNLDADRYAESFFDLAQQLGVKRVVGLGGVYAVVPYDKERAFSTTFSLPNMKAELADYALQFSNYEGGVSMGSFLNDRAEQLGIEYFTLYGFVPMYDFSQVNPRSQNFSIDDDYRAWHDLMRRLNHMFRLELNLSELAKKSEELNHSIQEHIEELSKQMPQLPVKEYITRLTADFVERPFNQLDDVWADALDDILKDDD